MLPCIASIISPPPSELPSKKPQYQFGRESDSEDEQEAIPEKRLRLAREYLAELEALVRCFRKEKNDSVLTMVTQSRKTWNWMVCIAMPLLIVFERMW